MTNKANQQLIKLINNNLNSRMKAITAGKMTKAEAVAAFERQISKAIIPETTSAYKMAINTINKKFK